MSRPQNTFSTPPWPQKWCCYPVPSWPSAQGPSGQGPSAQGPSAQGPSAQGLNAQWLSTQETERPGDWVPRRLSAQDFSVLIFFSHWKSSKNLLSFKIFLLFKDISNLKPSFNIVKYLDRATHIVHCFPENGALSKITLTAFLDKAFKHCVMSQCSQSQDDKTHFPAIYEADFADFMRTQST